MNEGDHLASSERQATPPVNFAERRYQQLLDRKKYLQDALIALNGDIAKYPWDKPTVSQRLAAQNGDPSVIPNDLLIFRATDQPQMPIHRIWDTWQEL